MNNNQAGKGDKPRPVKKEQFDCNFENINWQSNRDKPVGSFKKGKTTYKY
jgi:hypothetical protein